MQRPIFLVVADDGSRREALTMLADFASSGTDVALLIVDEHLAGMPAVDFLVRARTICIPVPSGFC